MGVAVHEGAPGALGGGGGETGPTEEGGVGGGGGGVGERAAEDFVVVVLDFEVAAGFEVAGGVGGVSGWGWVAEGRGERWGGGILVALPDEKFPVGEAVCHCAQVDKVKVVLWVDPQTCGNISINTTVLPYPQSHAHGGEIRTLHIVDLKDKVWRNPR